jgi:hypothetical protein
LQQAVAAAAGEGVGEARGDLGVERRRGCVRLGEQPAVWRQAQAEVDGIAQPGRTISKIADTSA